MTIVAERGYLIPAIGEQYVICAQRLEDSIRQHHPTANITILTVDQLPCTEMDCLYEFEPQTQLIIVSDDSILRVFKSTMERNPRSALHIRCGRTD